MRALRHLCVLLAAFMVKFSVVMACAEAVPYIRSPLARTIYSKMLMDQRLRNMDLMEVSVQLCFIFDLCIENELKIVKRLTYVLE